MLKAARQVEAKIKTGVPGKWAVGDGAYLQVAKVHTAGWIHQCQMSEWSRCGA